MRKGGKNQEHYAARRFIRGVNSVITFLEFIVLLLLLVFAVYAIWDNKRIDNENTASEYEMYKPTAVDTRTFDDFRKVNSDVCGWLTITDTGIDYPLVQGEDNDEYMNKTPDLKFALSGSLFLDYANKNDFSDYNTIIYGHHMEGPSMFGALDQYVDKDFFDSHGGGLLYYGGQWHELEIYAFLEVDAYDQGIYTIAGTEDDYATYLDYIKEKASQYRDIGVTVDDHIIVMSTCMTDKTNGRYIAVARIGSVTEGPQTQTQGRIYSRDGLSPQMLNLVFALIGGLIILVLILLYLWIRHRKRVKERKRMAENENVITTEELSSESGANSEKSSAEDRGDGGDRKQRAGRKEKKKKKNRRKATLLDDIINLIIRLVTIAAVIWVIFSFVFGLYVNSGVGMDPSVQDRDIIIFYRLDNEYTSNEAVVYEAQGEERLGRIVARGGDTVEITDEGLKVNGYLQQDYKNVGETLAAVGGTQYPVTLGKDEFFILGDNREESTDSRMFGPVKLDDIRGSVMTVLRRRDV